MTNKDGVLTAVTGLIAAHVNLRVCGSEKEEEERKEFREGK